LATDDRAVASMEREGNVAPEWIRLRAEAAAVVGSDPRIPADPFAR